MKRHLTLLFSALAGFAMADNVMHNMVSRHTPVNTNLIGAVIGEGLSLSNGVLSSTGGGGGGGDFLPLSGGTITDGVYSNTISPTSMQFQTEEGFITDYGTGAIYRFDPSQPDKDISMYFPPDVGGELVVASELGTAAYNDAGEFATELDIENATNGLVRAVEIPVYAYGGDWRLTVEDAGSTNAAAGTEKPTKDYISLLAETTGVYRRYKVEAEQEPLIIDEGATMPEVTLSINDPQGCVESFEDGVISSSGVSGVVKVYGMDTTGVTRAVSITMTPVVPGKVITEMWAEGAASERFIWNTNVFAKIAAVSTNAADMVDYRWCRHMDNWTQNAPADGHRLIPRALSRFGSDGRLNDAEWTWGGEGADKARFTPSKVNRDFFWPELLPGLQCFSVRVHETTASGNNSQCYPWLAVAPHYVITAGHYSSAWWHGMRYVVQPYFCTDLANERFMTASTDRMVGKVPQGDGVVADIMLVHVTAAIPSNCLARFATDETLERLSLSKFGKCAALTITSHQTIAPLCLNASQSGNIFSWSGEPGASTLTVPYLEDSGAPGKAFALEHPTHMFDSGTPVFLASPSGKIVPLTHYCVSNGRTAYGPRFGDVLASLSSMVRSDSGGAEDIQYWSFEDLATGVGTNSLEVVQ